MRAGAVRRGRPKEFQWTLGTFCLEISSGGMLLASCAHCGWQRFDFHKFPWRAPVPSSVRHRCGPVPSAEGDQKSFSKDKSAGRAEKPRRNEAFPPDGRVGRGWGALKGGQVDGSVCRDLYPMRNKFRECWRQSFLWRRHVSFELCLFFTSRGDRDISRARIKSRRLLRGVRICGRRLRSVRPILTRS